MKISKTRTQCIIIQSTFYTAFICAHAVLKRFFGNINRAWVDKTIQNWSNRILGFVGVKCKVVNPEDIKPQPGQATIIMCNHSSLYDIPLSFKAFPNQSIRMLAKKELSKIPIFGKGMAAAEFPFIDRKNKAQAVKDLEQVRKLLKNGIVMWIAPEGTRSKDGKLASFKKGPFVTAIKAKATIIPFAIRGAYNILPARTTQFNINQTAEIHIGKPINASQYTYENRNELMNTVHQAITELLGD
jgi:1-acyl-sn-glycerol-3-phosphate acyltransferase